MRNFLVHLIVNDKAIRYSAGVWKLKSKSIARFRVVVTSGFKIPFIQDRIDDIL